MPKLVPKMTQLFTLSLIWSWTCICVPGAIFAFHNFGQVRYLNWVCRT
jgi:hypothetical protein